MNKIDITIPTRNPDLHFNIVADPDGARINVLVDGMEENAVELKIQQDGSVLVNIDGLCRQDDCETILEAASGIRSIETE